MNEIKIITKKIGNYILYCSNDSYNKKAQHILSGECFTWKTLPKNTYLVKLLPYARIGKVDYVCNIVEIINDVNGDDVYIIYENNFGNLHQHMKLCRDGNNVFGFEEIEAKKIFRQCVELITKLQAHDVYGDIRLVRFAFKDKEKWGGRRFFLN